jgi:hypothetical protein
MTGFRNCDSSGIPAFAGMTSLKIEMFITFNAPRIHLAAALALC